MTQRIKRGLLHYFSILQTVVLLTAGFILATSPTIHSLTATERRNYAYMGIEFIDDPCGAVPDNPSDGVTLEEAQTANARTVIGIAKTYNLGQQGALIGLMTALAESHLKNYANTGVPISQQNPVWLSLAEPRPLGNDHDSVGIIQQRVSTGWSTFGNYTNGSDSEKDKNVTWQLMDPAYAAQAFFGTPPGAELPAGLAQPSALRKGLQNKSGWESKPYWEAAQSVQISAYDGNPRSANNFSSIVGENYKNQQAAAQSLLNQYWDSSPPVPLPIPITGGEIIDQGSVSCFSSGKDSIIQKIREFAWPTYRSAGSSGATEKRQAYQDAVDRSSYTGSCDGIDCGAFVTIVMRESGADPEYNTDPEGNTTQQIAYLRKNSGPGGKYTKVASKPALLPGDIAVREDGQFCCKNNGDSYSGHTFFYVGDAITTDSEGNPWEGRGGASASQCERAPMASGVDTFELYEWYHLN